MTRERVMPQRWFVFGLGLLILPATPAPAQLAVSANDGKAVLVEGTVAAAPNPLPDTVSDIDLAASPPKIVGTVQAATSVVGPPQSVAVAADQSIALVTG